MKKIINGKVLNTDTAKMIATVMIDKEKDIIESLYRTKSGAFFIYSVFPKSNVGKLDMSEEITLISHTQANEWSRQHLTESEYNDWFGVGSDENMTITVNITKEIYSILKKEKELTGETYGEIISYAIKNVFKK